MANLTAADLNGFHCSEQFFRHGINRAIIYTEGIQFVAERGGAYWLLDEIALANLFSLPVLAEPLQVWELTLDTDGGGGAWLTCTDGGRDDRPYKVVFRKRIAFTDFPLDSIQLYCEDGGDTRTIMLPGER